MPAPRRARVASPALPGGRCGASGDGALAVDRGLLAGARIPGADADVVVFPADHQRWKEFLNARRARSVRVSKTGMYTVQGLPPGDYYVVAIGSTSTREWQDPKFLEAAAAVATRITVLVGDKKTLDLVTSRLR